MLQHLKQGSFAALKDTSGLPGIILGSRLAQNTGMMLDSVVNVISPQGELTPFGLQSRIAFAFAWSEFSNPASTTSIRSVPSPRCSRPSRLFDVQNVVNTIELKLDDIYQAPEVAEAAEKIVGPQPAANTWMEQYTADPERAEHRRSMVTAITIGLIELVAALNILITLIMMVMEKNRDIAVLMSMGASAQQIRRIFMLQGVLIGVVGTVIGLALGYTLSFLADHYRWLSLNQEVYSLSYVPFNPRWQDGIWIAAAAILVSLIATLYPARSATRIAPVEALRYE